MSLLASPALWLDVVVAALLAATVAFAWRLHRRLAEWRADKAQLLDLVRDFTEAADRAERGVKQLKAEGDQIARALEGLVAKGRGLKDDLAFLVERAEPLADNLTDTLRRRMASPAAPAPATPSAVPPPSAAPSAAERDLMKALAGLR